MRILITGFEAFNGSRINPSAKIVEQFHEEQFLNHIIHKVILPVDNNTAGQVVTKKMEELKPEIVLLLGEASLRPVISLEKVAINWMDYRIADNSGNQIADQKIDEKAPDAYFSSLPIHKIYHQILESKIPVEISLSAGAFLCNQVFFTSLHYLKKKNSSTICGFIHVPPLPEQVVEKNITSPSMSLELSLEAIVIALRTCIHTLESTSSNH